MWLEDRLSDLQLPSSAKLELGVRPMLPVTSSLVLLLNATIPVPLDLLAGVLRVVWGGVVPSGAVISAEAMVVVSRFSAWF